jgi:hypothetical protein
MSIPASRSASGFLASSPGSSAAASHSSPHPSMALMRSCSADRCSSASPDLIASILAVPGTSASAGPRHSASASSNAATAVRQSAASRPALASDLNLCTSSRSASRCSR